MADPQQPVAEDFSATPPPPVPQWRRFAREVVWTPEVHAAVTLAGFEIPPEGRPEQFRSPSTLVYRHSDGVFTCWRNLLPAMVMSQAGGSSYCAWLMSIAGQTAVALGASVQAVTGAEVIAALQPMPAYGASGKALRAWLQLWGEWSPPVKAPTTDTPPPPMVL
jgi:hypothetical protein